jgi:predicted O-methyltransferase YrrM
MTIPVRLEELSHDGDARRSSPSAARNREDVLGALRPRLPGTGTVLEIASGTGEHAVHLASGIPGLRFEPTERDPEGLASCLAWWRHAALPNLAEPRPLDVVTDPWPSGPYDTVLAINFLHITPWSACVAFLRGAGEVLRDGGLCCIYGAMFRSGHEPEPSNLAFDERLRACDPELGVRHLEELLAVAAPLHLAELVEMPNNNVLLVLAKRVVSAPST